MTLDIKAKLHLCLLVPQLHIIKGYLTMQCVISKANVKCGVRNWSVWLRLCSDSARIKSWIGEWHSGIWLVPAGVLLPSGCCLSVWWLSKPTVCTICQAGVWNYTIYIQSIHQSLMLYCNPVRALYDLRSSVHSPPGENCWKTHAKQMPSLEPKLECLFGSKNAAEVLSPLGGQS